MIEKQKYPRVAEEINKMARRCGKTDMTVQFFDFLLKLKSKELGKFFADWEEKLKNNEKVDFSEILKKYSKF